MVGKLKKILSISLFILIIYGLYQYRNIQSLEKTPLISPLPAGDEVYAIQKDRRIEILEAFFTKYNSPLAQYSAIFIEVADQYGLDWTLLPAIASCESSFGKKTPSCAPYNPFGRVSTSSPCRFYRFKSFAHAIEFMGKEIGNSRTYVRYQQTRELSELAEIYNPGRKEAWLTNVTYFQRELK